MNVPELLLGMWSRDRRQRERSYAALARVFASENPRYPASVAAAEFLIGLVSEDGAPDQFAAYQLLARIAIGDKLSWLSDSSDPGVERLNARRRAGMTGEELGRESAEWVEAAPTEHLRRVRASKVELSDLKLERDIEVWGMAAYDAVRAGVPLYVRGLESGEGVDRMYAAYLLAWFPEEYATAGPAITRLLTNEAESVVAATGCVAAGLCGRSDDRALIDAVAARRGTHRGERLSAALGLSRLARQPEREVVDDLYDCILNIRGNVPHWPFLGGDMSTMAVLTIRDILPDAAPDRTELLVRRLGVSEGSAGNEFVLVRTLLELAFPEGPISDGLGFGDLSLDQQRVVWGLWKNRVLNSGALCVQLVAGYNLPSDEGALEAWVPRN